VLVLRYRASFEGFLREFYVDLERLVRDAEGDQRGVRSALHTAKGVFAQFSLYELSERIHVIEDLPSIDGGTLAAQTEDARKLQRLLHRTVATIRQKRAAELLGPIADAAKRLAERRGKQLDVVVRGGEERIPLRHAGVISALVHLARNAVDHGVETPSERGAKGPTATLEFEVARRDGALVVVVRDDGRGIDVERLVAKAVEAGGLSAPEAAALSPRERLELVFATGLSTAESVTDTSGRGVGAGAVKASVERLGGEVHVESVLGQGTTFVLRMPLEGGLGRVWSIPPPVAA
jgi:chemotaxis protein histidine kinase CheA